MLTAHLPAGYVLARFLPARKGLMAAALAGSILPDFDMIWFHFVDDRAFHHHRYWVHAPGFWLILAIVCLPLIRAFRPPLLGPALVFLGAIFLHILLDTITGSIMWLWPYSTTLYALFTVQPTHSHWILSFMAHWTFGLEILIWVAALVLWFRPRKSA